MKSFFKNEWVFIKQFCDSEDTPPIKSKIITIIKECGCYFYKLQNEDGHIYFIPVDSISMIGQPKKAKILKFNKLKLVK